MRQLGDFVVGAVVPARRRCAAAIMSAVILSGCSNHERATDTAAPNDSARSAPETAAVNTGTLAVVGKAPITNSGIPAIVILEPRHPAPLPAPGGVPVMDQAARTFIPPVLFVRTDHPTEFRNSDEEMHNINVKDGATFEQAFNVAVPIGERYVHTFTRTGTYDVTCDVHPGMSAQIVATSTPYATVADEEGNFTFPDVVQGAYAVRVYAGVQTIEKTIEVVGSRTEVDVTRQ